MAGLTVYAALLLALVLAACSSEDAPLPAACLADAETIERALQRAPATVTLAGGTRLSTCVSRARDDVELQSLGATLMAVADRLRARADEEPAAALRLGYLRGAAQRGDEASSGIAANLVRRIEQTTLLEPGVGDADAALERGVRAGRDRG